MKKIFYNISKVWALGWYFLIPIGFITAFTSNRYSIYDVIYYSFIIATIGSIPLVLTKYFMNKQQEKTNAIQ